MTTNSPDPSGLPAEMEAKLHIASAQDRCHLLELPAELQRKILITFFSSIEVTATLDPWRATSKQENDELPGYPHYIKEEADGTTTTRTSPPIYHLDHAQTLYLSRIQYIFPSESRVSWQSHVTFNLPSSLAMLDVFLAPKVTNKIRAQIKHVKLRGLPFKLKVPRLSEDAFEHSPPFVALPCIPSRVVRALASQGLLLDHFTYVDAWLEMDNMTGWGRKECAKEIRRLAHDMAGWKQLTVLSAEPNFTNQEVSDLVEEVDAHRKHPLDLLPRLELPTTSVNHDGMGKITGLSEAGEAEAYEVIDWSFCCPCVPLTYNKELKEDWGEVKEIVKICRGKLATSEESKSIDHWAVSLKTLMNESAWHTARKANISSEFSDRDGGYVHTELHTPADYFKLTFRGDTN